MGEESCEIDQEYKPKRKLPTKNLTKNFRELFRDIRSNI